jgi:hypothetical protein
MSDPLWIAIIVATGGVINTWINQRTSRKVGEIEKHAAQSERHLAETKVAIVTLEKNTNSITEQLVALTGKEQHAVGRLEGRAEVKAEVKARERPEEHSG